MRELIQRLEQIKDKLGCDDGSIDSIKNHMTLSTAINILEYVGEFTNEIKEKR